MNRKDLTNAMDFYTNHTETIVDFSLKCYNLCERIHSINESGKSTMTIATLEEVACVVAYHAMQFNGEWDTNALAEIHDFMRFRVVVIYPSTPQPKVANPEERARLVTV